MDEDVYDIDTMYREWQRYYKRYKEVVATPKLKLPAPMPVYDTESITAHVVADHVELFYTKAQTWRPDLVAAVRSCVHLLTGVHEPKVIGQYKSYRKKMISSKYPVLMRSIEKYVFGF
jgi:hypothetical protein